jgi:hypothetical protein
LISGCLLSIEFKVDDTFFKCPVKLSLLTFKTRVVAVDTA